LAILNWRIGSILISKFLKVKDLANFEISFKLLSVFYLIPIVFIQSSYPLLINEFKKGLSHFKKYYLRIFYILFFYGVFSYSMVFNFSDSIIPLLFGKHFSEAAFYSKLMFLVILFFPIIFLQANVMLVLHLEKLDMYFNVVNLFLTTTLVLLVILIFHSLSYVIISIVISFFIFHLLQDFVLVNHKIIHWLHAFLFHLITFFFIGFNIFFSGIIPQLLLFLAAFTIFVILITRVDKIKTSLT
jgi:O-antigen/teichoic acid export membrane protein